MKPCFPQALCLGSNCIVLHFSRKKFPGRISMFGFWEDRMNAPGIRMRLVQAQHLHGNVVGTTAFLGQVHQCLAGLAWSLLSHDLLDLLIGELSP